MSPAVDSVPNVLSNKLCNELSATSVDDIAPL